MSNIYPQVQEKREPEVPIVKPVRRKLKVLGFIISSRFDLALLMIDISRFHENEPYIFTGL
jgi:hypothetical protein